MSRAAAAVLALGLAAAVPAPAWASGLEVRLGGFFPRAQSNLFDDVSELFTVDDEDWKGVYGGAEFSFGLGTDRVELAFSVDGYSRENDTVYRDFVNENGAEIPQSLRLTIVPVGVSLRFLPADRFAAVQPYLTVGGDVFFYKYEERGEFIDFFADDEIVSDAFESDGAVLGGHVAVGLRIPLGHDFALTGEGRYQYAGRKRMGDDFRNNEIDVSGASATLGLRLRF